MGQLCGHSNVALDGLEGYHFLESSLKVPIKKLCDHLRAVQADYTGKEKPTRTTMLSTRPTFCRQSIR